MLNSKKNITLVLLTEKFETRRVHNTGHNLKTCTAKCREEKFKTYMKLKTQDTRLRLRLVHGTKRLRHQIALL